MMASFRPPAHEHPLLSRELSGKCTICCLRCGHPITGRTRCCLDCNVFIHESCAEWPLQVQHPCHPQHPLSLVTNNHFSSNYYCQECDFSAKADDLISTMPPDDGKEAETFIQHSAHTEHPLVSFRVTAPNNIRCAACRQEISGEVYGCRQCIYLLHESCARLPDEISQHPFHPQHRLVLKADPGNMLECNACGMSHQFAYCCDDCRFNLDLCCAHSTEPPNHEDQQKESIKNHFSHPHALKPFNIKEESKHLTCKACEQHISGHVYGCPDCAFFLHGSCAELERQLSHFLHSNHRLILLADIDESVICNCCSEASSGFVYNCGMCDFNLDIECALKTRSALDNGVGARVQHFAHGHILMLHYFKGYQSPKCDACKQPAHGLAYCCLTCGDFSLHLSCFQLPPSLDHEFHPPHPIILQKVASDNYVICDACNRKCAGFTYQCAQCKFHLDVQCASKKPTLEHLRHEHCLSYFDKGTDLYCYSCGESSNVDLYRCVPCDFNLHNDCIPLPEILQRGTHSHPVQLLGTEFNEDQLDQYGYTVCDKCGRGRNPNLGVYSCYRCFEFIHIDCLLLPLLPGKEKPVNNVQLRMLNEEIASAKEEMEQMKTQLEALLKRKDDVDSRVFRGA